MLIIVALLFILGLCAGSFINALVWRTRQHQLIAKSLKLKAKGSQLTTSKSLSILTGRSMCPNCRHELAVRDLIPILSWLMLNGRCRYCQKPIPVQYPVVELAGGLVFVVSYLFWPVSLEWQGNLTLFITWLIVSVGLLALLIYDFKWMMLPNRILYPTLLAALAGRLAYILFFSEDIIHDFWLLALSLAVASGIFWLIFTISSGKWIGYGDVRLGLITGIMLGAPSKSFLMIFPASILGTIYALPALLAGRQKMAGKVPYGPFLIIATLLVLLFGQPIIDWYTGGLG